ncbi:fructan beta-fructosidase [Devosia lucknowensis]|uniref:Fructan beta-fructosidase n=1 Tax=Devosia lucknowensis TaxID=1096929 RepID=A0A1Y6ELG3_9HYPH|nr:glycoside hydrolase family 32 protein [Devosia lucknowensis]SMQ63455.1 fructan beta-fructosidase [Devosia lucknowensis]
MSEKFRPRLHFSPRVGWMNDPNGLIRVDGIWHLFFQHDPASTVHGPMHWGHATSRDLMHWTEWPVALHPTAPGTCFSGSAIETAEGEIKLFYTAHLRGEDGQDIQSQCLVHVDRAMSRFTADAHNPVVPNSVLPAFRDPKVIWHEGTRRWIMLVTEGQVIGFYGSTELLSWDRLSDFGAGEGRHSEGPWECPDLVQLRAPDGRIVWMLIVGVCPGAYAQGSGTQYFLGEFDGTRFTSIHAPETELWLDHGRDYYAAQTFFDRDSSEPPISLAWASNWLYAKQTPTADFRGVMSLPRELRLIETGEGLRVAADVPKAIHDAFGDSHLAGVYRVDLVLDLRIAEAHPINLFGDHQSQFIVTRTCSNTVSIRTVREPGQGMVSFEHDYAVEFDWQEGQPLDLTLYVDRGLVELCAAEGRVWLTNLHFPDDPTA